MRIQGSLPELLGRVSNATSVVTARAAFLRTSLTRSGSSTRFEGNSVTIVERRPPWREDYGPEWSRLTVAQLRYEDEKWALYWSDRNGKWHFYDLFEPSQDLSAALTEINNDPTALFWG